MNSRPCPTNIFMFLFVSVSLNIILALTKNKQQSGAGQNCQNNQTFCRPKFDPLVYFCLGSSHL